MCAARGSSRPTGSLTITLPEESKPRINNSCLSDSGTAAFRRAHPLHLARDARCSYRYAPLDLPEQVEPSGLSIEPKRGNVGRIERPVDVPPVRVSRVSLPPQQRLAKQNL